MRIIVSDEVESKYDSNKELGRCKTNSIARKWVGTSVTLSLLYGFLPKIYSLLFMICVSRTSGMNTITSFIILRSGGSFLPPIFIFNSNRKRMTEAEDVLRKITFIQDLYGWGAVIIILLIIGLFFFIKSYFNTMSEKIASIPFEKQLADYNHGIQQQLYELNHQLAVRASSKLRFEEKSILAVIRYLEVTTEYLHKELDFVFSWVGLSSEQAINNKITALDNVNQSCSQTLNMLGFWCDDYTVMEAALELRSTLVDYKNVMQIGVIDFYGFVIDKDHLEELRDSAVQDNDYNRVDDITSKIKKLTGEGHDFCKKYNEEVIEFFEKSVNASNAFQEQARIYLKRDV